MKLWEGRCGISEKLVRCKIVLSIDAGSFSESLYDNDILDRLRYYEQNNVVFGDKIVRWNTNDSDNDCGYRLNVFTVKLSKKLLETKTLSNVEKFFIRIYANDFKQGFQMLDSDELDGTRIKELYIQEKNKRKEHGWNKREKHTWNLHNDLMLGVWIPQGNLDILGVHPLLGFRMGGKCNKLTVDFAMAFSFVKSPNTYQIYKDNEILDTDQFTRLNFGLDVGYELFRLKKNSIAIIGGIAYDGIEAWTEQLDDEEYDAKYINTLNLNIGLGYKFYFKSKRFKQRYLGIDFQYNFVNYKNPHGTNLDGNTYTINLIFGTVLNNLSQY